MKFPAITLVIMAMSVTVTVAQASDAGIDDLCSAIPSANYVPGIDAYGRGVISADLQPEHAMAPITEPIEIPMNIDVASALGVVLPTGTEMPVSIGSYTVFHDGRVTYQGRDLTSNAVALCHNREIGVVDTLEEATDALRPETVAIHNNLVLTEPTIQETTDLLMQKEF